MANPIEYAERKRHLWLLQKANSGVDPLSRKEIDELKALEKKYGEQTEEPKPEKPKGGSTFAADELLDTRADAAAFAEVDPRTISRWVREGLPRTEDKKYIKSVLLLWKSRGNGKTEHKNEKEKAEAQIKQHKAELLQRQVAQQRAELHSVDECNQRKAAKVQVLKRRLLAQPRRLAIRFSRITDHKKIISLWEKDTLKIIEDFARD